MGGNSLPYSHGFEAGAYYHGIEVLENLSNRLSPSHTVIFSQANLLLIRPLPRILLEEGCDVQTIYSMPGHQPVPKDQTTWLNKTRAPTFERFEKHCAGYRLNYWNIANVFATAGRSHVWGDTFSNNLQHVAF